MKNCFVNPTPCSSLCPGQAFEECRSWPAPLFGKSAQWECHKDGDRENSPYQTRPNLPLLSCCINKVREKILFMEIRQTPPRFSTKNQRQSSPTVGYHRDRIGFCGVGDLRRCSPLFVSMAYDVLIGDSRDTTGSEIRRF